MKPGWYLRRLRGMDAAEIVGRLQDQALRARWRLRRPDIGRLARASRAWRIGTLAPVELPSVDRMPAAAKRHLLDAAEGLLRGDWMVFAHKHPQFEASPDWFVDARSGKHAPSDVFAFDVPYRDEARAGNIKYIWEPSRHHHLTLLAAAFAVTGDERFAGRVADQLHSWWSENRFPFGPHWISGIEIGLRLISWAWVRRLLSSWPQAATLFENNEIFIEQLFAHQFWLAHFPSRGSSANNHIIAEAAGQFVASCAFPLFHESAGWRAAAARTLRSEAGAQTFACGSNRELATDYHGFVLELLLAAAVQGETSGHPLGDAVWETVCRMMDVVAATLDDAGKPPRQGDADDGIGLLLDDPNYDRWQSLLSTGARLFGAPSWWPKTVEDDLRTSFLTCGPKRDRASYQRPIRRPDILPDAGQVFLRSGRGAIWCRCDHGAHGFGSIAAHAHADALSIECRAAGVEIFADPGTYCYHGDPRWRDYFRSTFAHNTLELLGRDQSVSGGPFLWTRHAKARLVSVTGLEETAPQACWTAEHTGYVELGGPVHRRSVALQRASSIVKIEDSLMGGTTVVGRLCWHLGPTIHCELEGTTALLSWPGGGTGMLSLPTQLDWTAYRGDEVLPAGWYSPSFDHKQPSVTLVGSGSIDPKTSLVTELRILASPPIGIAP